jgi:CRISPR-associated protein Csc2
MASETQSMTNDGALDVLKAYFEPTIQSLIGMKTIQILLFREALDYVVLRTEETREINEVTTPSGARNENNERTSAEVRRVAFLGGKQKAVESREFERLLRESWKASGSTGSADQRKAQGGKECYLKDSLCLQCPRCALFGATSTESGKGELPNIKHRIEYSTAFSLLPYEDVVEEITFNAINDDKQTTGQALFSRACVRPGTLFASIVSLRSVTQSEFVLVLKTLLSAHSYGAESRTSGDMRNHIVGIIGGWEEVLTPLEFTLQCEERLSNIKSDASRPAAIDEIVETYWPYCSTPSRVLLLNNRKQEAAARLPIREGLAALLSSVRNCEIDGAFLAAAYQDVQTLRTSQGVPAK